MNGNDIILILMPTSYHELLWYQFSKFQTGYFMLWTHDSILDILISTYDNLILNISDNDISILMHTRLHDINFRYFDLDIWCFNLGIRYSDIWISILGNSISIIDILISRFDITDKWKWYFWSNSYFNLDISCFEPSISIFDILV